MGDRPGEEDKRQEGAQSGQEPPEGSGRSLKPELRTGSSVLPSAGERCVVALRVSSFLPLLLGPSHISLSSPPPLPTHPARPPAEHRPVPVLRPAAEDPTDVAATSQHFPFSSLSTATPSRAARQRREHSCEDIRHFYTFIYRLK